MPHYASKIKLRIDWGDIDQFQHVNNISILRYIQSARVGYLEKTGLLQLQGTEKKGPVIASITTQFIKPLFYPGTITIYSRVEVIKNTSFRIYHAIHNGENELTTEATDIIVFYDFTANMKIKIPDALKEKIASLENSVEAP
jgi:acyl-CoA thioester hydrolase